MNEVRRCDEMDRKISESLILHFIINIRMLIVLGACLDRA